MGQGNLQAPKCAACLFGKQGWKPIPGILKTKTSEGALTKNKLAPGELVFVDHYLSRFEG